MNKTDLIAAISTDTDISKVDCARVLDAALARLTRALASGEVTQLAGFGTFGISNRPERTGRNPRSGETITIKASKAAQFKPAKALKELGPEKLAQRPIGTGPFRFVEWKRDERLVMERNPDYWGGPAEVSRVTFRFIPEFSARLAALLSGEIDIMKDVPPHAVEAVEKSGRAFDRFITEQLAADLHKPSKSLHRMLGPTGNPNTANFFAILQVLQKRVGVKLTVKAA